MKVLLTGGAGDLAQTLVPILRANGDVPLILDVRVPRYLSKGGYLARADVLLGALGRLDLTDYADEWQKKRAWYQRWFPGQLRTTEEGLHLSKAVAEVIDDLTAST